MTANRLPGVPRRAQTPVDLSNPTQRSKAADVVSQQLRALARAPIVDQVRLQQLMDELELLVWSPPNHP